jgi:NAD(P)-dependent dehydrogenase (short-subunit alcohol dehydrogenase family)
MTVDSSTTKSAIVIGLSADIGQALCHDWLKKGWQVSGTYRSTFEGIEAVRSELACLLPVDLNDSDAIDSACDEVTKVTKPWDVLVLAPGLLEPVGPFLECDFDDWANSISVNFTQQLRFVHRLLSHKNPQISESGPVVIFFAGGGVNSAPTNYSAYTSSKIALTKMTELLAAEIPNVKFVIVGPGWVKTKIHESILSQPILAGESYLKTVEKFKTGDFTPMTRVVDCCNALIDGKITAMTGRNFSVVYDRWDDDALESQLLAQPDMYKLRRAGNDL